MGGGLAVGSATPPPRRGPRATVEHPTVAERAARGRAVRSDVPRSAHAELAPGADRPDPIGFLQRQAEDRIPELVPIRHGRMLTSPFAFYRGAALIMAHDLAATPATGLRVQLCGDAHLANFGVLGTPERRLAFDLNDFDETLPGPFEWDVKRLAASFEIAGRHRGFGSADREAIVLACVGAYRKAMADFAGRANIDVFYAHFDVDAWITRYRSTLPQGLRKRAEGVAAKARTHDSMRALERMTRVVDGEPRIIGDPPLVVPVRDALPAEAEALSAWVGERLRDYRRTLATDRRRLLERYRYVNLAQKVVGVGSVGTRAYIALLLGRDERDPLFLQFKEAQPSVLEGFAGRSEYRNAGHRVVAGQRLLQAAGDAFLGWLHVTGLDGVGRDFYVRQLRDWKLSADIDSAVPEALSVYARMCGWTLARAHARSGDAVAITAYLGRGKTFDRAVAAFSTRYADQNERDYAALERAVAAQPGP